MAHMLYSSHFLEMPVREAELVLRSCMSEMDSLLQCLAFYIYLSVIKVLPHKDDWWISPDGAEHKIRRAKSQIARNISTCFTDINL